MSEAEKSREREKDRLKHQIARASMSEEDKTRQREKDRLEHQNAR